MRDAPGCREVSPAIMCEGPNTREIIDSMDLRMASSSGHRVESGAANPSEDRSSYEPVAPIHAVEAGQTTALCGESDLTEFPLSWRGGNGSCKACRKAAADAA
jgi:hypothetical protein